MCFPKRLVWLFVMCVPMLFMSCKGSSPKLVKRQELKFTVDSTKLGDEVTFGGIAFRIPKGWLPADSTMLFTLKKVAGGEFGRFQIVPQAVFQDPATGAFVKVSLFAKQMAAGQTFVNWGRQYVDEFHSTHRKISMSEDWIGLSGMPAVLLSFGDTQTAQLKLAVEGPPPSELSFSIPTDSYIIQKRSIESSIGSVRKL
jgi:hypothetical protein